MQRAFRSLCQPSLSLFLISAILLLTSFAGAPPSEARTAKPGRQQATLPLPVSRSHAFINYRADGAVGCRDASQEEAKALTRRSGQSLHVISSDRPSRGQNLYAESTGLQIILRGTNQLENFPAAKAA